MTGKRTRNGIFDAHSNRVVKRANQILSGRNVNARLATDTRVDHGQQCRRNLDEFDATHVRRGHKSCQIPHNTSTERHNHCTAIESDVTMRRMEKVGDEVRVTAEEMERGERGERERERERKRKREKEIHQ